MYFKLLEIFILKILFNKEELNFTGKRFNPFRFIVVTFLVLNLMFTLYLLNALVKVYNTVEVNCPHILEKEKSNT